MSKEFIEELEARVVKDVESFIQSIEKEENYKEFIEASENIQTNEFIKELAQSVKRVSLGLIDKLYKVCKEKGLTESQIIMAANQSMSYLAVSQAKHYKQLMKEKIEAEKGEKA